MALFLYKNGAATAPAGSATSSRNYHTPPGAHPATATSAYNGGPSPPSDGVQRTFWYGHFTTHVPQCMQFYALITISSLPLRYTIPGQNQRQGFEYSSSHS